MSATDNRPLRVLVCGSRDWVLAFFCPVCGRPSGRCCVGGGWHNARAFDAQAPILERLRDLPVGSVIIHGAARGADQEAGAVARALGLEVIEYPVTRAEWQKLGKAAGALRNQRMLDEGKPDRVYAFNLGTPGTNDMIRRARAAGVEVIEVRAWQAS